MPSLESLHCPYRGIFSYADMLRSWQLNPTTHIWCNILSHPLQHIRLKHKIILVCSFFNLCSYLGLYQYILTLTS